MKKKEVNGSEKKARKPFSFRRWLDEWRMAFSGVGLLLGNWKFLLVAFISFAIFGTLMHLLDNGISVFISRLGVDFFSEILKAFLALFGINQTFLDWVSIFLIALLQGILIGLVVFVFKARKEEKKENNSENVQTAGLVAGLAVLSSGCPTCGTTLLAPLIGAIGSSGGLALAGTLSRILMILAILIALLALKKIGCEAYVIIVSRKYQKRRKNV